MISPALLSAETAAAEMKAVAAENPRCKDAVMHFVLSWKEGEQPTNEQWQGAVKHAMSALQDRDGASMGDHQYMAVAHRDTENFHVHVMANRVHPETYQANAPEWTHKTLDKACREIEAAQGWKHSNGLYKWDEDKGKAIAMTRQEREQLHEESQERGLEKGTAGTGKAAKMEAYSNAESLQTYCKDTPAKALNQLMQRDGIDWQQVHSALAKHGLELHKGDKGGYTVSAEKSDGERIHVKASDVFRKHFAGKAQRAATEEKLGEWEPAKDFLKHITEKQRDYSQHREPKRNPEERAERRDERAALREDLKARYQEYKTSHIRQQRFTGGHTDRERFKEQARLTRERREDLKARKVAPHVRKALLSIAAAEAVQSRELLRAELAFKRQESKPQDYRAWTTQKAQEGDRAAISQLRRWHYQEGRKEAETAGHDTARPTDKDRHDPADPRGFAALRMAWEVNRRTGDVTYQLDGKTAFTDHGERVSFGKGTDADAIEAGLKLAAQKYSGKLKLNGSDEFKKQAVEVAVERGINVQFADKELSTYQAAYKHQMQVDRQEKAARQRSEREPQERSRNDDRDR